MKYLYFIFLLIIAACKVEPNAPREEVDCLVDSNLDSLRSWYFVDQGTYWVYQEKNTLALDTHYVGSSNEFYDADGGFYFDNRIYSSRKNGLLRFIVAEDERSQFSFPADDCEYLSPIEYGANGNDVYIYPPTLGRSMSKSFGTYYYVAKLDTYTNDFGLVFNDVYQLSCFQSKVYDLDCLEQWIAKDVGIVRIIRPLLGEDWQLIYFHQP